MNSIGVDFRSKDINYDGKKIKLQIWDTAGEERYRTITSSYYRGAHAIAIVFDLTKLETFEHVKRWIEDIMNTTYFEVSAKNNENINEFFEGATKIFISKYICNDEDKKNIILDKNKAKNKNKNLSKKKKEDNC